MEMCFLFRNLCSEKLKLRDIFIELNVNIKTNDP